MAIPKNTPFRRRSVVARVDPRVEQHSGEASRGSRRPTRTVRVSTGTRLSRWITQIWLGGGRTEEASGPNNAGQRDGEKPQTDTGRVRSRETLSTQVTNGRSTRNESADARSSKHSATIATYSEWYARLQAEKIALYRQIDWIEEAQASLERIKSEALSEGLCRCEEVHGSSEEATEEINRFTVPKDRY